MEQMGSEEIFHLELDTPRVRSRAEVGTQTESLNKEGIQVFLVVGDQGPGVLDVPKGCRANGVTTNSLDVTELITKLEQLLLQVNQPPRNKRSKVQCWFCWEFGHYQKKCPNKIPSADAKPEQGNSN